MDKDAFWEWLYKNDLEGYEIDDAASVLNSLFGDSIGDSLYEKMDGSTLSLDQLHDIYKKYDTIKGGIEFYECDYCGDNFLWIDGDNPIRDILDIDEDDCIQIYCDDDDKTFCSEDCHGSYHEDEDSDDDEDDEEEDDDDEDTEDEDDDEDKEETERASGGPILVSSFETSEEERTPARIDDERINKGEKCVCGHSWTSHNNGVMGPCGYCECKAFTLPRQKQAAEEVNRLVEIAEANS